MEERDMVEIECWNALIADEGVVHHHTQSR